MRILRKNFYFIGLICWLVSFFGCAISSSDAGTTHGYLAFLSGCVLLTGGAIIETIETYLSPKQEKKDK